MGNLFSQEIQLSKITETTKKDRIKEISYPINFSLGYGTMINFKNDETETSSFSHIYDRGPLFYKDTSPLNNYQMLSMGISKRLNNFRFGINCKLGTLSIMDINKLPDEYWDSRVGGGISDWNIEESRNQKMNIYMVSLGLEYLIKCSSRMNSSIGLNVGKINSKFTHNYHQSKMCFGSSGSVTPIDWKYEFTTIYLNSSFQISPTVSLDYKVTNNFTLQLEVFYSNQINKKISYQDSEKYIIDRAVFGQSYQNYEISYKNPSKLGCSLNLVFNLGKRSANH